MITCKELVGKTFLTKAEMFRALVRNKQTIMDAKKATIKFSDPVIYFAPPGEETTKGEKPKDLALGDYIYPVINTINYLDSHGDVHLEGIWDKSATEQSGKTYYIVNHDLSIGKVISYPKEVEIMVKNMAWKDLGKEYEGTTQALIFKSKLTDKSNEDAVKAFQAGEDIQNSIRMLYVNFDLAVNTEDKTMGKYKSNWEKIYPKIANKEAADELGYFWAVSEAKIYKEGSAVLFGSNDATPVRYDEPKHIEPVQTTQKRAVNDTRTIDALNNLLTLTKSVK